jgi:subtilase family serine protease
MFRNGRVLLCLLVVAVIFTRVSFAIVPDRIAGDLNVGPKVPIRGNVHGFAKPENDLGRADSTRFIERISVNFRPSPAQQADLDRFLAELADRTSPNYHKYLTTTQFANRFGMSKNDVNKVVSWIESQGFTNVKVATNRNQIVFDGTVAQIESVFALEMHSYVVNGEIHLANAVNPSVPLALSGAVVYVGHLNDFSPKPRAKVKPNFTSYISGNHFLTPADFATIYDLNGFYNATPAIDGTGQKIAVVGQSTVATTDLNNFRTAAGLPPSTVTMTLMEGTATRCSGDEGESDLDLEWSGGIAKNASITFIYAGLGPHDSSCSSRIDSVWDALNQALTGGTTGKSPVAQFVSTSYGFCEPVLQSEQAFPETVQTWVQNGQALGVTLVAASGDAGAMDCDTGPPATQGLAVDVPASIPETTGAGGTEFDADSATFTTNNPPGGNPPYWAAAGASSDTTSSALTYIGETAWNDTSASIAAGQGFAASGGGPSALFQKPSWQTGAPGTMRGVPDVAVSTSADHDPYLFCSEDDQTTGGIVSTCTAGFRTGAAGGLTAVGGTSAAAPTFTAMLALINQYLGGSGLAPVNPALYAAAATTPSSFHDIKTGNNLVPCTAPSTNCPTSTDIGFNAGTGYDQVTGLGSPDGFVLAQAMATAPGFTLAPTAPTYQVTQGTSTSATVNVNAVNGFSGQVTYTCTDPAPESTCTGPVGPQPSSQSVSFQITTTAPIAKLQRPFDRGPRFVYATLFPGLLGFVFVAAAGKRSMRGVRVLGLVLCLGFSTLFLGSCGGSSSTATKDPGTPVGTYTVTVSGTATINNNPVTRQTTFQLVVQ